MIVRCPTCATRYRHDRAAAGLKGRCSRCFEVFPLDVALRPYRLAAVASAAAPPAGREPVPGDAVRAAASVFPGGPGRVLARGGDTRPPRAAADLRARPDLPVAERGEEPAASVRPAVLVGVAIALAWGLGGENFAAWVLLAAGAAAVAAWGFRWASRRI